MISTKSDIHRDEPRASGFRDALQRLREHAIAGHLQLRAEPRSVDHSDGDTDAHGITSGICFSQVSPRNRDANLAPHSK